MKQVQVQRFVCEYCNCSYSTEKECNKCEETHKKKPAFTGMRYVPYKKDEVGFPHTIELTFEDGSKAVYKFAMELDKVADKQ